MTPLDVLSFNIRYGTAEDGADAWPFRSAAVLGYLQETSPHLIGLQEALAFQLAEIEAALPHHRRLGVGRDDGEEAGEHAAVAYDARRLAVLESETFWLSPTPSVPGSLGWGATLPRVCTWATFEDLATGERFAHLNTHLDHLSARAREAGIALALERLGEGPAILTGDLNVGEGSAVAAEIRAAGLRDTFRTAHPEGAETGTFHGFGREVGAEKIDGIFASAGVRVLAAAVGPRTWAGRDLSDHLPVTARVELSRRA